MTTNITNMPTTETLAKSLFIPLYPDSDHPGVSLVLRSFLKVQDVPVDLEWIRSHYRSEDTVLVRIPTSWAESWGENVILPVSFERCTVEQLAEAVRAFFKEPDALAPCPDCGAMTWNRKHYPSKYRDQRCSPCWFKAFNAEWEEKAKVAQAKAAKRDAQMKAKGFTHKLKAVVHPKAGGDDYVLEAYLPKAPAAGEIETLLRRRRSAILNDYAVTPL